MTGTELLTVGHGTLAAVELGNLLRGAGVGSLVDVRRYPHSRRNPQFGREALEAWAAEEGVRYRWEERLGGRRPASAASPNVALRNDAFRGYADHMASAEFDRALDAVMAEAARHRTAVMCAEGLWWRCHRRLISDAVVLTREMDVLHLLPDGRLVPHEVTQGARVVDDRVLYDLGVDRPLPL